MTFVRLLIEEKLKIISYNKHQNLHKNLMTQHVTTLVLLIAQ